MSVDKLAVIVITDGLRRDSIEALSTPALEALRRESVWLRRHHSASPRSRVFVQPRSQRAAVRFATNWRATSFVSLTKESSGSSMSECPRSFLSAASSAVMCSAFLRSPKELRRRAACGCTAMPRPAPLMFRIRRTADMSFTEQEASVRAGNSRNPKHSM